MTWHYFIYFVIISKPASSFFDEEGVYYAKVAQLVEQRTENPCVGSSILPLGIFAGVAQWLEQLIRNQ